MTFEFIIYFSIVVIFVILVRHLPSALSKEKQVDQLNNSPKFNFFSNFNKVSSAQLPVQSPTTVETKIEPTVDASIQADAPSIVKAIQEIPVPAEVPNAQDAQVIDEQKPADTTEEKQKSLDAFFGSSVADLETDSLIKRDESITKVDFVPNAIPAPDLSKINSAVLPAAGAKTSLLNNLKDFFTKKPDNVKQIDLATPVNSQPSEIVETPLDPEQQNVLEGDRFFEQGNLVQAEECYLKAVIINPKNPKIYNRLGAIYLKNKNFKEALESFEAARDLDGQRASRHYNVALAAYESKNIAKARQAIDEALRLDPGSTSYYQLRDLISNSR